MHFFPWYRAQLSTMVLTSGVTAKICCNKLVPLWGHPDKKTNDLSTGRTTGRGNEDPYIPIKKLRKKKKLDIIGNMSYCTPSSTVLIYSALTLQYCMMTNFQFHCQIKSYNLQNRLFKMDDKVTKRDVYQSFHLPGYLTLQGYCYCYLQYCTVPLRVKTW